MTELAPQLTTAAVKDAPTARSDTTSAPTLIDGVEHHAMANVATRNGVVVEAWRASWPTRLNKLAQIITVTLKPGAVSAWHVHRSRQDALFVVGGCLRLVLFDAREGSPTNGRLDVFELSPACPALVVIPPEVWHGLQAVGPDAACVVNAFDCEYDHDDPDEWRLPPDSDEVPYRFP